MSEFVLLSGLEATQNHTVFNTSLNKFKITALRSSLDIANSCTGYGEFAQS